MEKKRLLLAAEKRHRDAFVDTVKGDVLLRNLKKRNAAMERKITELILNKSSGTISLKEQYEADISQLGDKIHELGLTELEVRENEVKLFEETIETAQNETQQKGVKTVMLNKGKIYPKIGTVHLYISEHFLVNHAT